jgi:hypothetical protein
MIDRASVLAMPSRAMRIARASGRACPHPDAAALRAALDARGILAELSAPDLVLAHGATAEAVGRAIAATGLVAYEISQQHIDLEQAILYLTTTGAPR